MQTTNNLGLLKPDQDDFYNIDDFNNNMDIIDDMADRKVDKITGQGLSANDYTNEEKEKLQKIEENANNYTHPDTHPATMITQDSTHKFITDSERAAWNNILQNAKDYSDNAYQQSTGYTDTKIAELINGAPSTLDTLGELAETMEENEDIVTALNSAIGSKASDVEFQAHSNNTTIHVTSDDRSKWNNMLSLSGGTVDGDTTFKNNKINILTLTRKDAANGAAIKFQNNAKVFGYLGFDGAGNPSVWEGDNPTVNNMHTILNSKNYSDYAAQKEHSHDDYLSLTGGTVDGLTAFRQGISGYTLGSSASHGKGTSGWQYAFQITTTSTYQNQFLEFSIVQRNRVGKMYIKLVSNKTAGVVSVGEFYTIGNISVAYVCSDNALDVYILKSEAYDEIDCLITQKGSYMNGTVITWVDTVVSSLPDDAVEVPANTIKLDNSIRDIILSCEDNTKPTKCFIKRNIDNSAAYLGFLNSNDTLGYIGINNLNIPVYRDKENHNYPLLIANGPNIGTVGINTPSSGGTALTLNNSNSNDDRTYLQFRNKDVNAGYLSMSDNDLYTYKKINGINGNCKVLDSENYMSVLTPENIGAADTEHTHSNQMMLFEVEHSIKLKIPISVKAGADGYFSESVNYIGNRTVKAENVNCKCFLHSRLSMSNSCFDIYDNTTESYSKYNITASISGIPETYYAYVTFTNNITTHNMFVEFSSSSDILVESIS